MFLQGDNDINNPHEPLNYPQVVKINDGMDRFTKVDDAISKAMRDSCETGDSKYAMFFAWCQEALDELNYDVLKRFKRKQLPVYDNDKIKLPDDYMNYIGVGVRNQVGEFLPLTYNDSIVVDADIERCHCDCGCTTEELCEAVDNYEVSSTDVTLLTPIKECNYNTFFGVLTQSQESLISTVYPAVVNTITVGTTTYTIGSPPLSKNQILALLQPYILNIVGEAVANLTDFNSNPKTLGIVNSITTPYPLTITSVTKNNISTTVNIPIANDSALDAYFASIGWTKYSTKAYQILGQTDVWNSFGMSYGSGATGTVYIIEYSCVVNTSNVTYTDTVHTCIQGSKVVKKTCTWGYNNFHNTCNYYIDLTDAQAVVYPLSDIVISNGSSSGTLPVQNSFADLVATLESLGFIFNDSSIPTMKIRSDITWTSLSAESVSLFISFISTACQTQSVSENCVIEDICPVEIKPCGCVKTTHILVNSVFAAGCIANAYYQRLIWAADYQKPLSVPPNVFGYFKDDIYAGIMRLNCNFRYPTVFLEYYSKYPIQSGEDLIPTFALKAVANYMIWMSKENKDSVPLYLKQRAEKQWYNEKNKLKQRLNGFNIANLLDRIRVNQRP